MAFEWGSWPCEKFSVALLFFVSKTRRRHWRRPHLCVDGEWSGIDISGSFALVARLLDLKLLGNRDGVSDGRLAYSTSPKIFPSHKMPLANSTS